MATRQLIKTAKGPKGNKAVDQNRKKAQGQKGSKKDPMATRQKDPKATRHGAARNQANGIWISLMKSVFHS